jgi:hypothetical protein
MRFFLAGIMQGSHLGAVLHHQGYRRRRRLGGAWGKPAASFAGRFAWANSTAVNGPLHFTRCGVRPVGERGGVPCAVCLRRSSLAWSA